MSDGTHLARFGNDWVEVPVAAMDGESLVVPVVAALVFPDEGRDRIVLQRRDKADAAKGRWEIPTGRWRAGETPAEAVAREVAEETGLEVVDVDSPETTHEAAPHHPFLSLRPLAVTVGVGGAYPALALCFACIARGELREISGETRSPSWVPVAELPAMLESPADFTGPTLAILQTWLAGK